MFRYSTQTSTALFFNYNQSLGPPYRMLLDTNFINISIQNKLEIIQAAMDCLFAKCMEGTHAIWLPYTAVVGRVFEDKRYSWMRMR